MDPMSGPFHFVSAQILGLWLWDRIATDYGVFEVIFKNLELKGYN